MPMHNISHVQMLGKNDKILFLLIFIIFAPVCRIFILMHSSPQMYSICISKCQYSTPQFLKHKWTQICYSIVDKYSCSYDYSSCHHDSNVVYLCNHSICSHRFFLQINKNDQVLFFQSYNSGLFWVLDVHRLRVVLQPYTDMQDQ